MRTRSHFYGDKVEKQIRVLCFFFFFLTRVFHQRNLLFVKLQELFLRAWISLYTSPQLRICIAIFCIFRFFEIFSVFSHFTVIFFTFANEFRGIFPIFLLNFFLRFFMQLLTYLCVPLQIFKH